MWYTPSCVICYSSYTVSVYKWRKKSYKKTFLLFSIESWKTMSKKACIMNTQWLDSYRIIHLKVLCGDGIYYGNVYCTIFGCFKLIFYFAYCYRIMYVVWRVLRKCLEYMESVHTSFLVLNKNHRNNNHQQTFCVSFSIIELYRSLYNFWFFSFTRLSFCQEFWIIFIC